jgi:hypothetical protein
MSARSEQARRIPGHERRGAAVRAAAVVFAATVACVGCGGSSGPAGGTAVTTTEAVAGPPAPTTLPDWVPPALGIAGEDNLLDVVGHDLTARGFTYSVDQNNGTVTLNDGRTLDLSTIAVAASTSDPTTWPGLVARAFDVLLKP